MKRPPAVVVVFVSGDARRFGPTINLLVDECGREVVVAAARPAALEGLAGRGVETRLAASPAEAVTKVVEERNTDVFIVHDVVLLPSDTVVRAEEILGRDLRYATVSFLSNMAGPLSFPAHVPNPLPPAGFDHDSLTRHLRATEPRLPVTPVPYAAGGAVMCSAIAFHAIGGFEAAPEAVSFDAQLADLSLRGRARGFIDLLDPETFVTRRLLPGQPMLRPVLEPADREWLLERHPQLIEAFELEPGRTETPLVRVTRAAKFKTEGLRIVINDATLGPFEPGAQITTLAIIDALAKRDDVSEVGVALSAPIPAYARAVLGQPKVRPALAPGGDFSAFVDYDVLHRTAQPDKDFEVEDARRAARRVVVSILDLIAYRAGSYHARAEDWLRYRYVLQRVVRAADGVTTISQDVADMLELEQLGVPRDRVFPILYGTDHISGREAADFPAELARLHPEGIGAEFLLCLGTDYTHKNRDLAIAVRHELARRGRDLTLVLAGPSVPFGSTLRAERNLVRGRDGVVFLPSVTSRERNWLLRHAAVVLYPTSAEGFGLVPFEAARFGSPTVTVDFGPLRETTVGVPVLAESWDPREFADAVERLLTNPDLRRAQVDATLAAAGEYSWQRTIDAFVTMYRSLLGRPPR